MHAACSHCARTAAPPPPPLHTRHRHACMQFIKVHIVPKTTITTTALPELPVVLTSAYATGPDEFASLSLFR